MQGLDGFLHVRPFLEDSDYRGFAMFFNPTNEIIKEMAEIPLYYTGLQTKATVILEGDWATKQEYKLDRDYSIEVPLRKFQFLYKKSSIILILHNYIFVDMKAKSYVWMLIQ